MAPSRGPAAPDLPRNAAFLLLLILANEGPSALASSPPFVRNRRPEQVKSPITASELSELRKEAKHMFIFGFNNYLQHAWPKDELRPLSCGGHNSQGGIALTLIDALDSLVVFGEAEALQQAVRWLGEHMTLDVDARVHVFEVTIRALGGLLSAHMLLTREIEMLPRSRVDVLLNLAIELGDRLLPAFQTPSGIPLSWVNLSKGVPEGEIRITCTACATTLLLEFGVLSRLSGRPVYEQYAQNAVEQVFGMRNPRTGLVGNTLDVDTRTWIRYDSTVGAGIDSMYEYLAKAFLLFGNDSYLDLFVKAYVSAMRHLRPHGSPWLGEADMNAGIASPRAWVSSLSAFWPGMQALVGQTEDAAPLFSNWTAVWQRWGGLPELFDMAGQQRHPLQRGYPLRPELMESACLLHAATRQGQYLEASRLMQNTLVSRNAGKCGFASIADVETGALEDTMESFFLSESTKYLYLLHSNASSVADFVVLSTEGHILFPMTAPTTGQHSTVQEEPSNLGTPEQCKSTCHAVPGLAEAKLQHLRDVLPLVSLDVSSHELLRRRRCRACRAVTDAMVRMKAEQAQQRAADGLGSAAVVSKTLAAADVAARLKSAHASSLPVVQLPGDQAGDSCPADGGAPDQDGASGQSVQHFICNIEVDDKGQAQCSSLTFMPVSTPLEALSDNVAVVRVTPAFQQQRDSRLLAPMRLNVWDPDNTSVGMEVLGGPPAFSWEQEALCADTGNSTAAHCGSDESLVATGLLVKAEDALGCSAHALRQQGTLQNAIAVLDRGSCMFTDKVLNAQGAGAKAAVIIDSGEGLHGMAGDGSERQPTIPSILVPASSGSKVMELMAKQGALHGSLHTGSMDHQDTDSELSQECAAPDESAGVAEGGQEQVPVRVEMLFTTKSRDWLSQQLLEPSDLSASMATMMSSILSQNMGPSGNSTDQP